MSLSTRRANAPSFTDALPTFQVQTPNRSMHGIRSLPSSDSLASYSTTETRNTLPQYVAEEDDNPDVITTSIEIDPDADEEESDLTTTPPAVKPTKEKKVRTRSGLAKLFSRTSLLPTTTPGVRCTKSRMLKSISKDPRHGFPLALPVIDGKAVIDVDSMMYRQFMSRINILLATGAFEDVRLLLESHPLLGEHISLVKFADIKKHEYETIQVHELPNASDLVRPEPLALSTVPELDPSRDDSDDSASNYTCDRRGSIASLSSATSSRSSFSQRIRSRLERKEEWCLVFD